MSALTLDDFKKETVRIACARGKGIRKRCRKSERIYVQGVGMTDAEAIEALKVNLRAELSLFREYEVNEDVHLFDGERSYWNGHTTLAQVLMPWIHAAEHNFVSYPYELIRLEVRP